MLNKIILILRNIARVILILAAAFWFVFALLSGAEELGGGVMGIIKNSMNALPWLLLLVIAWAAIKWELIGGVVLLLFGIFSIFFFNTFEQAMSFIAISLPFILVGGIFILSALTNRKNK